MRHRNDFLNDLGRLICLVVGTFCSLYAIRSVHDRKLNVTFGHNTKDAVVTQVTDPVVFWGIVIFMSLIAAALFYCAFFAKDGPNA
ncbi:hypothetical protein [Pedosphaera parvula]|uniref:Uncharacterized protein n=1 Tax=Pedosphaera parvula (strain Ellin514) TaxID=320771 RepID=B9XHP6_PEDPL|nr:hypothetical protein [Pedosphaera parvula]EEF60624.1 hypothetical protein Cflav_PD6215 [Pedosphaera parvula Ellin514]